MASLPQPPQTPRHHISRDQRIIARTLRSQGHTYAQIAQQLHITQRQVQKACTDDRPTPRKAPGRSRKLSEEQLDEIIDFVSTSKETRRMPYSQLIQELNLTISVETLRRALARRGYHRCKALRKPPLSDRTKALRLAWALEHVNWTREQWNKILWTDETWVTSIYHRTIYVTRRAGEEFDDTCVRERVSHAPGWMFWGSFYGDQKGPCLFWEKEWKTINSVRYTERIVPLIDGMVTMARNNHHYLTVMQDGAPSHRNLLTLDELHERGIYPIDWPPYSPDLNPIEQIWDWMKDWIGDR